MIQNTELRRGNKVLNLDNVIDTVIELRDEYYLNEAGHGSLYKTSTGIPLSPEILEKCGFEADNKTEYGGWLSPEIIGGSRLRLVKEDVGFSFFNGICKTVVKDLHTLQNYYPAWTSGEEQTITSK